MALTAENQKALDNLGKLWNDATTQQERDSLHSQANTIRNGSGLKAGTDYDPNTGAAIKPLGNAPVGAGNPAPIGNATPGSGSPTMLSSTPPGFKFTPQVTPAAQNLGQDTMQPYGDPNQVWTTGHAPAAGTGPSTPTVSQAPSQSQSIMDYINSLLKKNKEQTDAFHTQAMTQAQTIAKQKRDALYGLINSLKGQQKNALQGITNSTQDAKAGLEDSSFQKYLSTRQGMADRGLAGSGLASDQDTRLLLSKNRDLSGIYRDAALNTDKVNTGFGDQINKVNTDMSGINVDQMASEIFNQMNTSSQTNSLDQAKIFTDLFKTLLPYDQATMKDKMGFAVDQDKSAQGWAKINLDQWKAKDGSMVEWAKVGQADQQLILDQAKVLISKGQLDLEKWKTLGYMPDPSGSGALVPTAATSQSNRTAALDEAKAKGYFVGPNGEIIPTEQQRSNMANEKLTGDKLIAQVTQWTAQNKIATGKLNLSEEEFKHKVSQDQATITRLGEEFTLSKDKVQLDGLKAQLSGVDSEIRARIANGQPIDPVLAQNRDNIMQQISGLFQSAPKRSGGAGMDSNLFTNWTSGSSSIDKTNDGVDPQYKTWIEQSGNTAGVKPDVIYKMMMAESSGNPNATSTAGAKGLMQFMPDTAKGYGVDVNDPHSSIIGATKYMKDLLNMFGNDYEKAVAAYNWGEGNIQRAVSKYGDSWKNALPAETKGYLKKVLGG